MSRAKLLGWVAAALSALWFVVHTFVGGAEIAAPLRGSDLAAEVMATSWMVWHMITAILFLLAVMFALATLKSDRSMMLAASAVSLAIALAGLAAPLMLGVGFSVLPQGFLFVISGGAGLLAWRAMGS